MVLPSWRRIADRAWRLFADESLDHVVRPSIPVLFFGDLKAYAGSPLRVITVGLNPSRHEFPANGPFQRFPGGDELEPSNTNGLLAVLSRYFRVRPYDGWFRSYEPVLHGLNASYYPGARSTALHTDLISPLATNPTWSKLGPHQKLPLETAGIAIWHEIVSLLQPQVILLSIARSHLDRIDFQYGDPWTVLLAITKMKSGEPRSRAYEVLTRCSISPLRALLVFGQATQKPFGSVSKEERLQIGRRILSAARS